jgi:hypothetical protein
LGFTAFVNNFGVSRLLQSKAADRGSRELHPQHHPQSLPLPQSQDPNQAYIVAPVGHTPRRLVHHFFGDQETDTDASPSEVKSIMPPPQTPSLRRSPSKGDRGRSPTKFGSKRY